eukprot:TRINITY_DN1750_c0_g1_i2.p1 TRINITY_DN1750_c0_g1~~TRINITY_DN1750_c0_g1_i2.p1  ORF type:complete len:482 (+),score=106.77 TRINITY_DN1750_c0_g1_i2:84-1529(+)
MTPQDAIVLACSGGALLIALLLASMMYWNRRHTSIVARGFFFCTVLLLFSMLSQIEFFMSNYALDQDSSSTLFSYLTLPLVLSLDGLYMVNMTSLMFKLEVTKELLTFQKHSNQKNQHPANRWFVEHRYLVASKYLFLYSCVWIFVCFISPVIVNLNGYSSSMVRAPYIFLSFVLVCWLAFYAIRIRAGGEESNRWGLGFELWAILVIMLFQTTFVNALMFNLSSISSNTVVILFFALLNVFSSIVVGVPVYQGEMEKRRGIIMGRGDEGFNMDLEDVADRGFEEFLEDPRFYALFRNHLANEMSVENLLFWSDVKKFKQKIELNVQADSLDPETMEEMRLSCLKIYTAYIKSGAIADINIPHETRQKLIEEGQKIEAGDIPQDSRQCVEMYLNLYADAEQKIFYLMRDDPFKRFLRSSKFTEYRAQTMSERVLLKNPSGKLIKNGSFRSPTKSGGGDGKGASSAHNRTKSATKDSSISNR